MAELTCMGSFALGSACAGCSRCRDEWVKLRRDGWRLISPNIKIMDATTDMEITRLRSDNQKLREALEFYADPESYHAIMIVGDSPCGPFSEDFDENHGDEFYRRPMPGMRARAALAEGNSNG